jgi:hypothetical protein
MNDRTYITSISPCYRQQVEALSAAHRPHIRGEQVVLFQARAHFATLAPKGFRIILKINNQKRRVYLY